MAESDINNTYARRDFMKAGLAAAAAVAMEGTGMSASEAPAGYIDAHSHLWTPDTKRYPLAAPYTQKDMVPPSFTPEEFWALAKPCGVGRLVIIQMSFYGYDNSYMLEVMRSNRPLYSGVAVIDETANPVATMRELAKDGVRGFRIQPKNFPAERWLDRPGMAEMWNEAADSNQAMCPLIDAKHLGAVDRMCERYPKTPVVIDHFARIGVDGTVHPEDLDALVRLSRHAKTHVKISAYYALGKKKSPYTDLVPMIRRLIDAYGPERLMWATDCPYQVQEGHVYADSVALVRDHLDFVSATGRDWLLRKTAEKVFFS